VYHGQFLIQKVHKMQLSCLDVPAWLCYFCQANKFIRNIC